MALDLDHPLADGMSVPPHRLASDLTHMGAWREVDERFNRYAYLNMANLNRLRRTAATMGSPRLSLAAMGAAFGVSPEAVRQTMKFADCQSDGKDRRERIIPAGIRRLEQLLAQEF